MRLQVACSLRAEPPVGGQVMVVTGSQQGVWRQAFFPCRVAHQQGLEMTAQGIHCESKTFPPAHL
jgi:hypothetical protein